MPIYYKIVIKIKKITSYPDAENARFWFERTVTCNYGFGIWKFVKNITFSCKWNKIFFNIAVALFVYKCTRVHLFLVHNNLFLDFCAVYEKNSKALPISGVDKSIQNLKFKG